MIRKGIGAVMVSAPFIAIIALIVLGAGPLAAAIFIAAVVGITGLVIGGLHLMEDR